MIVGNDGGRAPGATARTIAWAAVIAMSLVAAMPLGTASAAERTIVVRIGDDDGFGGTQGTSSEPGDVFVTFTEPSIAPGVHADGAGTDATTVAPWTPYVYRFTFQWDPDEVECVIAATFRMQHGSIARRSDGSGYGFAEVSARGASEEVPVGQLWSSSTGEAGSPAEETVKLTSIDVTEPLFMGGDQKAVLEVLVDGSGLADPIDQFAIDWVELELRVINDGGACPADVDGNGAVDVGDLVDVLSSWGECPPGCGCAADVVDDFIVDVADLLAILEAWGPCDG